MSDDSILISSAATIAVAGMLATTVGVIALDLHPSVLFAACAIFSSGIIAAAACTQPRFFSTPALVNTPPSAESENSSILRKSNT